MGIQIISYRCNLKNRMGRTISSSIVRDVLLDPEEKHSPLKALSKGLKGIKKGEVREVSLRADEAYGLYDPKLVVTRYLDDTGVETVTFDGNHPLAGQDLVFEVYVLESREATTEELWDAHLGRPLLH